MTRGPDRADASADRVLRFLARRGLLRPEELAASPTADDVSASHTSFRVRVAGRARFFVKCADAQRSRGRDLGSEASVYRLGAYEPDLARVLPRCFLIGARDDVLVLDALPGEPLSSALDWAALRGDVARRDLAAYGAAVALFNGVRCPRLGGPPWLLEALEPGWGDYAWLPPWCGALLRRLRASPRFAAPFHAARLAWHGGRLVHGDVRWANAILDRRGDRRRIWIVDWELACLGDPAWDVGCAIADVVSAGVQWCPPASDTPWEAVRPFLGAYRRTAGLGDAGWRRLLASATRLAGVRLVQSMIEQGYDAPEQLHAAESALRPWSEHLLADAPGIGRTLERGAA